MERKSAVTLALITTLLLSGAAFGGIVLGTSFGGDVSGDFICDNQGPFTDLVSTFLTIFVFGAPAAGVVIYFADKAANSAGGSPDWWMFDDGSTAIKAGFGAPILLYMFQFLLSVAFGIEIGCLTP